MTKAEIRERFHRVLERAMARPLDSFTPLPVHPKMPQRMVVLTESDGEAK